jgi:hypothetical protein
MTQSGRDKALTRPRRTFLIIFDSSHDTVMPRAEQTPVRRLLASSNSQIKSTANCPDHRQHHQIDGCQKMKHGRSSIKIVIAGMIALSPVAGFAAGPSMNVRGTITRVDGNTLEINERDGKTAKVQLADNAKIASVAKASLSDIKPGSFIGTAATPRTDGTLQAIEIHIFPESMRGTGEGNRSWDLAPKSSMTNGTVAQRPNKIGDNKVSKVDGNSLTVEYNGGTKVVGHNAKHTGRDVGKAPPNNVAAMLVTL